MTSVSLFIINRSIYFVVVVVYSKCASVAAHFELKEVFDKLIITLCKFTTLLNNHEVCYNLKIQFVFVFVCLFACFLYVCVLYYMYLNPVHIKIVDIIVFCYV